MLYFAFETNNFCIIGQMQFAIQTNTFCILNKYYFLNWQKVIEVTRTGLTRSGDISEGWRRSWKCYKLYNSKLPELVSFHKIVRWTGKSYLNTILRKSGLDLYCQKYIQTKLFQVKAEVEIWSPGIKAPAMQAVRKQS